MFNNSFLENRFFYETMWKNIVEPDRPQMTIWYGARSLHARYLRLRTLGISSTFPQQQCLHERASILRYTHIACLVYVKRRCLISLPYYVFILFTYLNLLLRGVFATLYILISMPLKSLLNLWGETTADRATAFFSSMNVPTQSSIITRMAANVPVLSKKTSYRQNRKVVLTNFVLNEVWTAS